MSPGTRSRIAGILNIQDTVIICGVVEQLPIAPRVYPEFKRQAINIVADLARVKAICRIIDAVIEIDRIESVTYQWEEKNGDQILELLHQ